MSAEQPPLVARETPEEAAAAVRNGRPGYLLCIQGPTGHWAAWAERAYTTKGEALMVAQCAILRARDPARVVVLDARGQRLRVPVPRELRRAKGGAP